MRRADKTHRASHPCCFKPAYVLMKPPTDFDVSSCSRPMMPGETPPTAQLRNSFSRSSMLFGPYDPHDLGASTISDGFIASDCGRCRIAGQTRRHEEGCVTHDPPLSFKHQSSESRFQPTRVRLKTSLAMARTRLSASPCTKGNRMGGWEGQGKVSFDGRAASGARRWLAIMMAAIGYTYVRRTPELRDETAAQVVNRLHRPAEFAEDLGVVQRCHLREAKRQSSTT